MRFLILSFCTCFFFSQDVSAQQNFQKTYSLGIDRTYMQDIYFADSCYYFVGSTYDNVSKYDAVFGKINLLGELEFSVIDSTSSELEWVRSSKTDLQRNYQGNLMTCYVVADSLYENFYPVIKEYSPNGSVLDTIRVAELISDSVKFSQSIKLITDTSDSSYYVLASYEDLTPSYSNPVIEVEERGAMVLKLNWQGDTIWTKRFYHKWTPTSKPIITGLDIQFKDDSTLYISLFEERTAAPTNYFLFWSHIRYYTLSKEGEIQDWLLLEDGQYIRPKNEFLARNDGTFIQGYLDSRLNNDNTPDFEYQGVLTNIAKYNNKVWKDSLIDIRSDYYYLSAPNVLKYIDSNTYIGAYTYYERDTATYPFLAQYSRIFKRKTNGELVWERDYSIGAYDSIRGSYNIVDVELTPDGGFVFAGMVIREFFEPTYSYGNDAGYVLKTNCFGFLDSPQASFSIELKEDLVVEFVNTSSSAGHYYWDFGDGTSISLGEGVDTLNHRFPDFGPYTVSLIVEGCNGEKDTFALEVSPIKHYDPPSVFSEDDQFVIFPNPVYSGKDLFIYLNQVDVSQKDVYLDLFTLEGKLVTSIYLDAQESVHKVERHTGAGTYLAVLRKENSILARTKLVLL